MTGFQRISGMSEVDIDLFCDGERPHMKEGMVLVDEENGTQFNLRIQRVAVQLVYGRRVKADDLLKISATTLEEVLNREEGGDAQHFPKGEESQVSSKRKRGSSGAGQFTSVVANPVILQIVDMINSQQSQESITELIATLSAADRDALYATVNGMEGAEGDLSDEEEEEMSGDDEEEEGDGNSEEEEEEDVEDVTMSASLAQQRIPLIRSSSHGSTGSRGRGYSSPQVGSLRKAGSRRDGEQEGGSARKIRKLSASVVPSSFDIGTTDDPTTHKNIAISSLLSSSSLVLPDENASTLRPYVATNQLEYLEDSFQLIALMIKGNVARLKDDMKKEGTSRFNSSWNDGSGGELKHSKRELAAKLKLHENRVQMRLSKTLECGFSLPRLEVMSSRFQLDAFEKKIILLLIGETVLWSLCVFHSYIYYRQVKPSRPS